MIIERGLSKTIIIGGGAGIVVLRESLGESLDHLIEFF